MLFTLTFMQRFVTIPPENLRISLKNNAAPLFYERVNGGMLPQALASPRARLPGTVPRRYAPTLQKLDSELQQSYELRVLVDVI